VSDIAIRAEGLGKQYRLGEQQEKYKTLRDSLAGWASAPRRIVGALARQNGHPRRGKQTIWALRDVSFEVERGEAVGVIGRNGAGKSTLLKIFSRITEPTEGTVDIFGRVGSLLEVGTGFHSELSGRENIYLNGAILGMKRAEIQRKFDEMVAFAEIETFIDTPVKHYSSGMYLRLAFSVAAHLEPEILLVDEVLAVGDAAFQKKCLGKMGDVSKAGKTVLFVSHNLQAISTLCVKTILLDKGCVVRMDETSKIIDAYLNENERLPHSPDTVWESPEAAPGNDNLRLRRLGLQTEDDAFVSEFGADQAFRICLEYWLLAPQPGLWLDLVIYAADGSPVFESVSPGAPNASGDGLPKGLFGARCAIPANLLNEGSYRARVIFYDANLRKLYEPREDESVRFSVHDTTRREFAWYGKYLGHIKPNLEWTMGLIGLAE
jgi:homopolymeric O-antigen transport system ATP-binding protein